MLVPVLGQHVPLLHLFLHDLEVGDFRPAGTGLIPLLGPAAVDVVAIHGAVAGMPLFVLFQNRSLKFLQVLGIPFDQGSVRKQSPLDGRGEHLFAKFRQVHAVEGVGL